MRWFLVGASLIGLLSLSSAVALAQEENKEEEERKNQTRLLLQKADEEYRVFFPQPKEPLKFWAAIKFEVATGRFDVAALHLKRMLESQPAAETDKALVKIEEAEGLSAFLRLTTIKKWSDYPPFQTEAQDSVQKLIQRVTDALEKHLSDPARLSKLIKALDAETPEERAYAFIQLNRSKERAVPLLIEALQTNVGNPLHARVVDALVRLDRDVVPAFLEVLKARDAKDAADADLRATLLDVIRARNDRRALPYLWHLSAAPQYPAALRAKAKGLLARFLDLDPAILPPVAVALTQQAERYYKHKVKFADPKGVRVWRWTGKSIDPQPIVLTPAQAEEFFGVRSAREALELDPGYRPAQVIFLKLTLERTLGPELSKAMLQQMPPSLAQLLGTVDGDLLLDVLDEALTEGNVPVVLGLIQALGERGEARAARPETGGPPRGLVRALYYPDRRVQYAAAQALVRLPGRPVPVAAGRVVEVLRRFLVTNETPTALVLFAPAGEQAMLRQALKGAGFQVDAAGNIRESLDKLHKQAGIDVLIVHDAVPVAELPFVLTQLRGDADAGPLPLFLLASKAKQESLQRLASRHANVWLLPEIVVGMADELKSTLEGPYKEALGPALSAEERKALARGSLDLLWRMARNELQGYDVRPAGAAVVQSLAVPDLAVEAIEILGRLPGTENQQMLAGIALDPARDKLRMPAAIELNRHIQKNGVLLSPAQIKEVKNGYQAPDLAPDLKTQLAQVLGNLGPSVRQIGVRLFEFRPPPPPAPMPAKEKE